MLKKWIAGLLALGMLASFAACDNGRSSRRDRDDDDRGQTESRKDTLDGPFAPGDDEFPSASDSDPVSPEPEVSYEDQIALIVSHKDTWATLEDYAVPYSLAITDLDQNGRLELILSVCMGTGYFSYNSVYEVKQTFDGVEPCVTEYDEYSSSVDLTSSEVPVFYDRDQGTYYFSGSDFLRSGWAWNGTELRAFWLKDGVFREETVAAVSNENSLEDETVTTYYDADGNEITEKEYENAMGERFSQCEEMTANFLWQSKSVEELQNADSETLTALFEESWEGFSLH